MIEHQIVRLGVGRKFQTPSVYEELTVFENFEISYSQRTRRAVFAAVQTQTTRCANSSGPAPKRCSLHDALRQKAGRLSHGQKQWLEMGMLLIQQPDLLLLDEPVAGMSPRERELTSELLQRIARGRSLVVIEHDMDFVKRIAHKVTVLHQGRVLAEGSAQHVQADPV
jgi:urea transport system ATP-binding protein